MVVINNEEAGAIATGAYDAWGVGGAVHLCLGVFGGLEVLVKYARNLRRAVREAGEDMGRASQSEVPMRSRHLAAWGRAVV